LESGNGLKFDEKKIATDSDNIKYAIIDEELKKIG